MLYMCMGIDRGIVLSKGDFLNQQLVDCEM